MFCTSRKLTRTDCHLRVASPFILILTLFALPVPKVSGARHPTGHQSAVAGPPAEGTNAPSPVFHAAVPYSTGSGYVAKVAVGDLNGDGKLDMVVANGRVGVLLGIGDGTFQPVVTYDPAGPGYNSTAVAVADLNGDGKLDLAVAANCNDQSCNQTPATIGVLLGNGDGTFAAPVNYAAGHGMALSIGVADINGDGKLDAVVANWDGGVDSSAVGVLLGNGDGSFGSVSSYNSGADSDSVTIADVNNDGKPDLLVGNANSVAVMLGNGNGTFAPKVEYTAAPLIFPIGVGDVAVHDVNGDGKPDLVVANQGGVASGDGSLGVLLGNGNGTFQAVVVYDSGGKLASSVAIADVNNDGIPDLLASNYNYRNGYGTLGVLTGNGDGTFQSAVTFDSAGLFALSVAVGDLNGDGNVDALVANQASFSVGVLLNAFGLSSTTTTVAGTINPVQPGQRVDYIATVTTESGATPTGTVTFRDGIQTLATLPLSGNQARLNYIHYTQNDLGAHAIAATYSGDADNGSSTSPVFTENVQYSSRIDLKTSGSPSLIGQPVTFTATPISHGNFVPDGEIVTFFDSKTELGTATTAGGQAKFTTSSLSAKRHTIRAAYPGDAIRQPSTASVPQVVNKYSTTSSLTSSPNPSVQGQTVTFTATVTPSGPFTPTGKVKFLDGTTGLGYATLSGSVATFSKSHLAVGTHSITAQYLGDATSNKSTSSAVSQVVNP
jgi:uncharacterized protein (DUF2141 family)